MMEPSVQGGDMGQSHHAQTRLGWGGITMFPIAFKQVGILRPLYEPTIDGSTPDSLGSKWSPAMRPKDAGPDIDCLKTKHPFIEF